MYHLFIATPERVVFEGDVHSVIAPGTVGYFEVLTNHSPLISTLKAGTVTVTDSSNTKHTWKVTEGYFEVVKNKATLLADAIT